MEARIITCSRCRRQIWVTTKATIVPCPACRNFNSTSNQQPSSRDCHISNPNVATPTKNITRNFNSTSNQQPSSRDCHISNPNVATPTKNITYIASQPDGDSIRRAMSFSCSEARPRKRALLCGVSYKKGKHRLKGTINDVRGMTDLLVNHFGFPKECIRILTDEEQDPDLIPTRKNIEKALKWLVEGCSYGDSLVFYFAGHGSQARDYDRDEIDGFNETICPLDFEINGDILDNDLNTAIVRPLTVGVTLHAIVDACHSATILDLPYLYNMKEEKWVDNHPPSGAYKGTSAGIAFCISACKDDQIAVDTTAFPRKMIMGALTYNFIQAIKRNPELTYGGLLTSIQTAIDEANEAQGLKTWLLKRVYKVALAQEVQLSSSEMFDIYAKEFKL